MSEQDYADGLADGLAGKDPQFERLALGANRPNDYERGYIDSGKPAEDAGAETPCELHNRYPCWSCMKDQPTLGAES